MASKKSEKPDSKPPVKKKKRKVRKKPSEKPHYVNAKEFTQDITDYYNSGGDEIGNKLGESIFKIAKGLSFAPNFINYSYKDDMIGDAIVRCSQLCRVKNLISILAITRSHILQL